MLGILRTILSLFVFSSHLPQVGLNFHIGVFAVTIFYFISGMLMVESFERFRAARWLAAPSFYLDRLMRIYPAYLAVMLATAFLLRHGHGAISSVISPEVTGQMLWGNFNLFNLNFHQVAIVNPTWSLAAEAQFYMILPLLAVLPFPAFALIMAASLGFHVYGWHMMDVAHADYWSYRSLPGMLFIFCMGICFARRGDRRFAYLLAATVATQLVLLFVIYPLTKPYANNFLLVILLGSLVVVPVVDFARRTSAPWLPPIDRFIGNLCYPIFLVHFPAMYCTDLLLGGGANLPKSWFLTATALCLIFALALHFLVQLPSEKVRYAIRGFGKARIVRFGEKARDPSLCSG
jgi:peptidoglycan/LPS O-acetylase OafA/YrhL